MYLGESNTLCFEYRLCRNILPWKELNIVYVTARWTVYVRCLEKICLIINSSANFVFYSLFGSDLRTRMKKCIMYLFCQKKKKKFEKKSTKILRLSEKGPKNKFRLQKADNLYDIYEKDENDMSPIHIKLPFTTTAKVNIINHLYC